jgi:FMN reductase
MNETKKIAVVSAGVGAPSTSRMLADRLLADTQAALRETYEIEAEGKVFELRDTAKDVTFNLLSGFPSNELDAVINEVISADGLIIVTPVFNASYNGLFKSFLDIIDPNAFRGMPTLIGATGGTPRHSQVLDYAMRPVLTYMHADVAPIGVYAATEDWAGTPEDDLPSLPDRVRVAAKDFAARVATSTRGTAYDAFEAAASPYRATGGFSAE